MSKDSFDTILSKIEDELARCYGFVISISARDCLTQSAEAKAIAAAGNNRAATLIYQNPGEDELQLGLYFQPKLIETLSAHDPSDQLNHENLDAFCVAVEELSHFHLIANRAYSNQVVSRLELEWQGEIDKWLMSGSFLEKQTGNPHFAQLTRLIFDQSICIGFERDHYEEAHRLAALYCYKLLPQLQERPSKERTPLLRKACRSTYDLHWAAKLQKIRAI